MMCLFYTIARGDNYLIKSQCSLAHQTTPYPVLVSYEIARGATTLQDRMLVHNRVTPSGVQQMQTADWHLFSTIKS